MHGSAALSPGRRVGATPSSAMSGVGGADTPAAGATVATSALTAAQGTDGVASSTEYGASGQLWFVLLGEFVGRMRAAVKQRQLLMQQQQAQTKQQQAQTEQQQAASAQAHAVLHVQRALSHIWCAFAEEAVARACDGGGGLPLHAVVVHLSNVHAEAQFGEMRHTLLALLSSCAYEGQIIGAAGRLIMRDAYNKVRSRYHLATHGQPLLPSPSSLAHNQPKSGTEPLSQGLPPHAGSSPAATPTPGTFVLTSDTVQQLLMATEPGAGAAAPGKCSMPRAQQLGAGQHMQHQLPHIPQQQWPPQQRGVATGEYMLAAARKYRTPGAVTINARALRPINQLSKQDSFMTQEQPRDRAQQDPQQPAFDIDDILQWAATSSKAT